MEDHKIEQRLDEIGKEVKDFMETLEVKTSVTEWTLHKNAMTVLGQIRNLKLMKEKNKIPYTDTCVGFFTEKKEKLEDEYKQLIERRAKWN